MMRYLKRRSAYYAIITGGLNVLYFRPKQRLVWHVIPVSFQIVINVELGTRLVEMMGERGILVPHDCRFIKDDFERLTHFFAAKGDVEIGLEV
jgi:hypothetical protein